MLAVLTEHQFGGDVLLNVLQNSPTKSLGIIILLFMSELDLSFSFCWAFRRGRWQVRLSEKCDKAFLPGSLKGKWDSSCTFPVDWI